VDGDEQKDRLKKALGTQAEAYAHPLKARYLENIEPMLELVVPQKTERLLDIGTGSGFTALGFAPFVLSVVGVDDSPEAVAVAKRQAAARGAANAEFRVANHEHLPFADGSFEIVTCRFVFHHFSDPPGALAEMKRVLAPAGRIMLYDILTSLDPHQAEVHNRIEKTRDPSHVRMLNTEEFLALFRGAKLDVAGKTVLLAKREFTEWMEVVGADPATVRATRALMEADGAQTGLCVRVRDGAITFTQTNVAWLLTPRV
jgi:SAM-dependent methyltransferase